MKTDIKIYSDNMQNVLCAYKLDTISTDYYSAPNDSRIIIERNPPGNIVGIRLFRITKEQWENHPDRNIIPNEFLIEFDQWFNKDKTTNENSKRT